MQSVRVCQQKEDIMQSACILQTDNLLPLDTEWKKPSTNWEGVN